MSWEIAVTFGITAISFILMYLALNLDSKHAPIKFFLIMVSLFMLITELSLNKQIILANELNINNATITNNLATTVNGFYQTGIYIGILVFSYFIIFLVINLIKRMSKKGDPSDEFEL